VTRPPTAPTDATGSGVPLLLVPGGLTGWISWQPHAERLAEAFRVIRSQLLCVDLGLRDEPLPPGYGVRAESRALLRALDDLRVDRAHVVGWSFGGAVALDVALEHPDRVRTLVLVEPSAYWVLRGFDRFGPDAAASERLMASFEGADVTEDQLDAFVHDAAIVGADEDARRSPRWPTWLQHRRSLRAMSASFLHEDDVQRLRGLDTPTLLFKGVGSAVFDVDTVDLIGAAVPNARVVELPGAHALPIASMGPFLEILRAFIAEHRAGT
jgi:pimeloyl-ACP methyl ester carboxylesterase